ncbi:uncharacterized protein [Hyperolius riggenbachi]|uniref:uncharacterized protein isoform X2 n=1 Tax=Hyperolius riggenbachi TaxID=752182 RepID=UPI0035A2C1B2
MEGEITVSETTCIQNTTIQHSMPSNGKSGGCDWLTNNREISMKRKSLGKQSQDVKQYSGVEMPVISTAGRKRQAGPPTKKCKQGKKKLSDITGRVINIENGQRTKQPITTEKDQSSDTVDKENCAENFERTKTRDDLKKAGYGEANMARPHPENETDPRKMYHGQTQEKRMFSKDIVDIQDQQVLQDLLELQQEN